MGCRIFFKQGPGGGGLRIHLRRDRRRQAGDAHRHRPGRRYRAICRPGPEFSGERQRPAGQRQSAPGHPDQKRDAR